MKERLTDLAFALGWDVTRHLPEPVVRWAFEQVGDQAWVRQTKGVRRLAANLRRARPDATPTELGRLTRVAMRSYMRYWCEAFRLPQWSRDDVLRRLVVHNEHILRDSYAEGRGVIATLPHMANWDLVGAWACYTGMPFTTVQERLKPEQLYQRFVAYRESLGFEVLPLSGGENAVFSTLVERVRGGGLICLLADRDLSAAGLEVELLGHPAKMPAGPAMIARRTGAALMPVTLNYSGAMMEVTLHDLVPERRGREGLHAMTQEIADIFSAGIREQPEDWHMLQQVFVEDLEPE